MARRFKYDGILFEEGFRADLLVEGRVTVELKSVEKLAPVHSKQVYAVRGRLPIGRGGHVPRHRGKPRMDRGHG